MDLTDSELNDVLYALRVAVKVDLDRALELRVQGRDQYAPKFIKKAARLRALIYEIENELH